VKNENYEKSLDIYNDGKGKVEYVEHMGTDLSVVNSARVSFGKHKERLDDRDNRLIKYLIKHRHTSTLEHNVVTFRFCVPLFVRGQHHRHRTWSYNEISRRYTEVDIRFYEPASFRTQHKSNRQASNVEKMINPVLIPNSEATCSTMVQAHHGRSMYLYEKLIDAGVCREQARGVLHRTCIPSIMAR
jgi:thymidylate synthase (FAD)